MDIASTDISAASIGLISTHIKEYGESLHWSLIETPEQVQAIHATLKAYMPDGLLPYISINSATKSLERVAVFDANKKKLISLYFEAT